MSTAEKIKDIINASGMNTRLYAERNEYNYQTLRNIVSGRVSGQHGEAARVVSAILGRVAQKPKRKNKNFAQNLKKISEITDHTDVTSAALITNAVNNSGLTIKEYATRHGYPYHTVRNLVYGKTCGKFGLPAKIVASVMCKDTPLANGVSLHSKHKKLNVQLALKGYHSLTDWANKHGFNHDTVRSAIRRYCGAHGRSPRYNSQTPKILAALSKTLGQSCMGLQVTNELAHAQPWLRQQAYWRQNVIC